MKAFAAGELQMLVSTTVVEVGVDVPNASVMIVEHAERFGLSQLHQLRGRVGRDRHQSYCFLLYQSPLSEEARERLKAMTDTTDGFEIAERDLRLRGPGDFFGTRQAGLPTFRLIDLVRDQDLLDRRNARRPHGWPRPPRRRRRSAAARRLGATVQAGPHRVTPESGNLVSEMRAPGIVGLSAWLGLVAAASPAAPQALDKVDFVRNYQGNFGGIKVPGCGFHHDTMFDPVSAARHLDEQPSLFRAGDAGPRRARRQPRGRGSARRLPRRGGRRAARSLA